MRIGFDARFYGAGPGTGIGRYVERLLHYLSELDRTNEYVVFLRDDNFDAFQPSNDRFQKVRAPWRWYSLGEQLYFPRLLSRGRFDLIHFPHFNVPAFSPKPFVVTVHDLILNKFPTERASTLEPVFYWMKHSAYLRIIRRAISRSEHVFAVTENTRKDILQHYRIAPAKVSVTYEACDPPASVSVKPDIPRTFGITGKYLLYVGTSYPHKNLERLIQAANLLHSKGEQIQLVLVGRNDFFSRELQRLTGELAMQHTDRPVIFTGFVEDDVLDGLYRGAALYVFPSLYEGFGLPGLEAMARGVPVVAARASSLPEVYGEAAEYFDPTSVEDIARTIQSLIHHPSRLAELRERGFAQLKRYSWRRMAEETLEVYTRIGANMKP